MMDARLQDPSSSPDLENPADPASPGPGWQAWALLAADSLGDFLHLLKIEGEIALRTLPGIITLSVARVPLMLLTWISFGIFAASIAYALTDMVLAAAGTFFAVHVLALVVLEIKLRRARRISSLPESRKALALVVSTMDAQLNEGLAQFFPQSSGVRHAHGQRTPE